MKGDSFMDAFRKLVKKLSKEAAKWAWNNIGKVLRWLGIYSPDEVARRIYDALRR